MRHNLVRAHLASVRLQMAMNATDELINGLVHDMEAAGTLATSAIIIAAKHGQNPLEPSLVCNPVVSRHACDKCLPAESTAAADSTGHALVQDACLRSIARFDSRQQRSVLFDSGRLRS